MIECKYSDSGQHECKHCGIGPPIAGQPGLETPVGPYCDCGHAVADHIDDGKCRFSADGSCMCSTVNRRV